MAYKDFQAATVLPAQDVNQYLMDQSVIVFDDASARSATLSAPIEGMVTYLKDTNAIEYYDGSSWESIIPPSRDTNNLVQNGAMRIYQRGALASGITASGYYTVDRWTVNGAGFGTFQQLCTNDAPNDAGFSRCLKMTCTTANSSLDAGDFFAIDQRIEGYNLQEICKGTPNAKPLTLSFWVKSNVTGTFICELREFNNNRSCSQAYTINASATWEYKTVTFPPDTVGALADNDSGNMRVYFGLGFGSDYTTGTLQTSWGAVVNANRYVGQTNITSTVNNYWQVTGVQLETGDSASPFKHLSIGEDLILCQRYYQRHKQPTMRGVVASGGFTRMGYSLPVEMRANPSLTSNGGTMGFWNGSTAAVGNVAFSLTFPFCTGSVEADITSSGFGASGQAAIFYKGAGYTFELIASAEL